MQRKKIENTCKRHCGTKQLLGVTLVAALEATSGLRILASTLRAVGLVVTGFAALEALSIVRATTFAGLGAIGLGVTLVSAFETCPENEKEWRLLQIFKFKGWISWRLES